MTISRDYVSALSTLSTIGSVSPPFRRFGNPLARRLELFLTIWGRGRLWLDDNGAGGDVEVAGDLVQSLEGGMKPSGSARVAALTYSKLFFLKEASDTVIWR